MPIRPDVKAVFLELDDGIVLEYDGNDILVKEDLTHVPPHEGRPKQVVRYMTILIQLAPDPTIG